MYQQFAGPPPTQISPFIIDSVNSIFSGGLENKNLVKSGPTPGSITFLNCALGVEKTIWAISDVDAMGTVDADFVYAALLRVTAKTDNVFSWYVQFVRTDSIGTFRVAGPQITAASLMGFPSNFTVSQRFDLGRWEAGDRLLVIYTIINTVDATPRDITIEVGTSFTRVDVRDPFPRINDTRWLIPLAEPILLRKQSSRMHPRFQQETAYGRAAPFPETTQVDKWYPALNEPVRIDKRASQLRAHQQVATVFGRAAPFPETTTIDRYLYPLAEPKRFRRGVLAAQQEPLAFFHDQPVRHMSWFNWLADPKRFRRGLRPDLQVVYASAVSPIIPLEWMHVLPGWSERVRPLRSVFRQMRLQPAFQQDVIPQPDPEVSIPWFGWLTEPKRFRARLREGVQQTVALQPPPVVIEWYSPLAEPVRIKLGLPERLQMTFVTNPGPTPGRPYFKVNIIL
jgi:hypothetical protein